MSEMLERVAKAIWLQRCKAAGADPAEGFTGMAWENQPSRHAETLAEARAAIEAMLEPIPTIEDAFLASAYPDYANFGDAWRAMIDEALK